MDRSINPIEQMKKPQVNQEVSFDYSSRNNNIQAPQSGEIKRDDKIQLSEEARNPEGASINNVDPIANTFSQSFKQANFKMGLEPGAQMGMVIKNGEIQNVSEPAMQAGGVFSSRKN